MLQKAPNLPPNCRKAPFGFLWFFIKNKFPIKTLKKLKFELLWSRDWGGRVFLFYTLSCCSHIMQPIRDDVMLQHTAGERQWSEWGGGGGGGALSFIYSFRLNFGSNRKQKRETRSDKNHVKFKMFPESRWRLNMRQNLKARAGNKNAI